MARGMDTIPCIRALLWILYFLLPSEGGIVDGIPAGRVETIGILLVVWIAAHHVRVAGAWLAAAIAIGATVAALAVPGDRGLHARYYATAAASGPHERSTDYRDRDFTRVDERLDFVRGDRDFPLAFFNDHTRFNFLRPGEPDRRDLEFAVAWTGWWYSDGGAHVIYLHAPKSAAQIAVDTSPILTATPASSDEGREITLSEGWHRLHVTFSSPYGGPREFSAGEIRGGVREPFDVKTVRTERIDDRQELVARALTGAKPIADLFALGWLSAIAGTLLVRRAGEVWQGGVAVPQAGIALFMAAGAIEALRFAWPWAERFRVMTAGDDPMTYEGYARDILFNGILMNGGAPLGHGEPFYYQAFYPYFLAASHALFGEGMFGVLFLQRLFVALTAVAATRIAMKLRGEDVWPIALLVSALFVWWKFAPIAADLLNESLYIPLLMAWVASLVTTCLQPSTARAAMSGLIGGLAAITRSTAMLSWLLVWPACFHHFRSGKVRKATATLVVCTLAAFSLVAIRNALVSYQFAPTSTELGITLLGGNPPPPDLVIDPSKRTPLYDRLGVGGYTREVIEYAIAAPGHFAANMGRKALFALGFYEPYAEGWGYSPVYIAVWVSAILGLVVARRHAGTRPVPALIPLLVAITQYAAVVIVYPKGERLILPVHTLLLPYAAIAAYEIWMGAMRRFR
jgi:hypothetical protein